ncbi:MAG: hypothetical protein HC828_02320 [Blastochloris sp.]|nr:hypothetical protein [Blastochloris sp.]
MDESIPPHTVPVHYQPDSAQSAAVHIVDVGTRTALCGSDTSGPGWTLAAMAISACCLACMMIYQQRRLAEKRARWEAGATIQEPEPDLWGTTTGSKGDS